MLAQVIARGMISGGVVALSLAFAPSPAKADWACEVALCISNPAGPMAVSECVPPIKKLYRHLARGGSFPLCQSADGYVNFTKYGIERQEECPAGSKTVYRDDSDSSFGRRIRYCEKFVPVNTRGRPGIRDRDGEDYEVRIIDGNRVFGKVVTSPAPRRAKPRYLEYVVQGDNRRLWW